MPLESDNTAETPSSGPEPFAGLSREESDFIRQASPPKARREEPREIVVELDDDDPESSEGAVEAQGEEGPEADGAEGEPEAARQKPTHVPHGKFDREYRRRIAAEQELTSIKQRMQAVYQQQQAPQPVQQPVAQAEDLDIDADPRAVVLDLKAKLGTVQQQLQQRAQEETQRQQWAAHEQQLNGRFNAETVDVSAQYPDFVEAQDFLIEKRHRELDAMGWKDPQQRQQQIYKEYLGFCDQNYRAGQSAALKLYEVAKASGFAAKPKVNIAALQKGQEAARTLSGTAGGNVAPKKSTSGPPTSAAQIDAMSTEQLAKWMDKDPDGFKRVMMAEARKGGSKKSYRYAD